ncbi:MAG: phosphatidylserine decarboxylase family protein [Bacteroidaceae bacterium]|nr:phosphatidylserine decarboxylase family protein [Candidatus Equimonas faecalis]MCQ2205856.1 phosphatidylserine decarboxylase family protein [Bacteroidaceae bacterium]
MGRKIKKIKKIRLHHEGNKTLLIALVVFLLLCLVGYLWLAPICVPAFWALVVLAAIVFGILVNFFQCPIRTFEGDTDGVVVAPADGKIVVIEEVEENEYFHDRRLMVSIFMSLTNVHANWFPVDGVIKCVKHQNGNYYKAWLPKASVENERSTVVIQTAGGHEILVRQVAGAMARRIVTYASEGDHCFIDEHMGFIKFGSRVDTFLPLGSEVLVEFGAKTTGNQTIIARLPKA